jgi:hypothetical protein
MCILEFLSTHTGNSNSRKHGIRKSSVVQVGCVEIAERIVIA